jgi:hypothetical protein
MTHLSPEETARVIELSMHFAREGMTEELAGSVDHGLPTDVQDDDGNTPLMLAAYHGHAETVRLLIQRGADLNLPNKRNQAPVADAGTPSARDTASMFDRLDLLG